MSRPIAVLRPEPGNRATAAAIEGRGRTAIRLPLFVVRPLAWEPPDPAAFDALILTSANALRHGGPALSHLRALPVHAVGAATAEAARAAGFQVVAAGSEGAAALVARAEIAGTRRALHLAGRERTLEACGIVADVIVVYASEPAEADVRVLEGAVALIQSARAGARLAQLADAAELARDGTALAAVSAAAAEAAGTGWERVQVSPRGNDGLIDAAITLAD